ncbi:hypothetical protein BRC62_02995 [Halobacteriales archaeon QH_10_67_13]|nr:MAG: hypothetical protein BRC62_02995 [Halobacteriales archaeon QH_10_67_13]
MYGVVTRNAEELSWAEFDRGFYEVKDVTGRQEDPVAEGVNMISCHGDSTAAQDEALVPVSEEGLPATRERQYFDWGYVCPTHDSYREGLLELLGDAAAVNGDVRLDDVGFPRPEYCHCERCQHRFADSEFEDRKRWRASVITAFVASARERVPDELSLTLYPDPMPGHLYERSGLDLAALEAYVDRFVVPLYDTAYETTYWLEALARGFLDRLSTPVSVELYAVEVELENLVHAAEVAETYADEVYFGYDAGTARAAIRRLRAEESEGTTHDPR